LRGAPTHEIKQPAVRHVAGCELWKASDHSEQTITKAYRSGKIVKAIKRKPSSN
jgi:hypothetical protein